MHNIKGRGVTTDSPVAEMSLKERENGGYIYTTDGYSVWYMPCDCNPHEYILSDMGHNSVETILGNNEFLDSAQMYPDYITQDIFSDDYI